MKTRRIIIIVATLLVMSILTVTMIGCKNASSTEYDVIKQTKKDNYSLLNENYAQHNQTVLIGDSIIEIYNTELFDGSLSTKIYNRGISGDTSDKLLERLEDNALNIAPQNLVVLVGTNDLSRKISADVICDNISKVIDKSKDAHVGEIIICSLLPVNKSINNKMVGTRKNSNIKTINSKLKTACEKKQVTFVDLYTLLEDKDGNFDKQYTYDGLHPNTKGYIIITQAIEKTLNN
ncbi:MAG: hypothetical protein K2M75_05670 [Clostridia bacterium]|nr:hypothetical protein [Clostridia bacterium]